MTDVAVPGERHDEIFRLKLMDLSGRTVHEKRTMRGNRCLIRAAGLRTVQDGLSGFSSNTSN
jgi:hypothetical protein